MDLPNRMSPQYLAGSKSRLDFGEDTATQVWESIPYFLQQEEGNLE
jgi:hypothetical protein